MDETLHMVSGADEMEVNPWTVGKGCHVNVGA